MLGLVFYRYNGVHYLLCINRNLFIFFFYLFGHYLLFATAAKVKKYSELPLNNNN